LLGIAASLKLFFGLFFLYFLLRREWRALAWFTATALCCALLPAAVFGFKIYSAYFSVLQHINWYSSSWNASILGVLARLFGAGENNFPLIHLPGATYTLFYLCAGLALVSFIKALWPNKSIAADNKRDLDFSLTLVAMLLLSPLAWLYYFPLLIIPVIVLLQLAKEYRSTPLFFWPCSSILLSGITRNIISAGDISKTNALSIFTLASCNTATLIILFGSLLFAYRLLARQPKIYSKQLSFHQGANEESNRSVQMVHEDCERVCNAAENSSAKSISGSLILAPYEWIFIYIVILLPSLLSILTSSANYNLLNNTTFTPSLTLAYLGS
jgi:hypothetical protein